MINNTILRYFYIVLIILIVLLLGVFFYTRDSSEEPYQVLTSSVYEKGTKVDLYRDLPPDFPQEIVLEDKVLDYSGSVINPQGKTQTTVSDIYIKYLPDVGWTVVEKISYPNVSIIRAEKGGDKVIVSIAPVNGSGVMVTFQYEK